MSLADRAFSGAVWSVLAGLLSRGVGLVGTLVMTRFLAPDVMGEVATATVLAFTVSWATQLGLAKYLILKVRDDPEPAFHVLVLSLTLAGVPLLLLVVMTPWLAQWFGAPRLVDYLPAMALTVFIRRIGAVPEKLLVRDLRFRVVAGANAAAEIFYVAVALLLVTQTSLGGRGIVIGNVLQALLLSAILVSACGTSGWLVPVRLRMARFREILSYGLPLGVTTFLYEFARYGDKLVFTRLFGPARTGEYNLAYNLADVPATQIGEQVSSVLLPTLMQVQGERRCELLVKAVGLQAAAILPLALGIAAVAPALVTVLLTEQWWGMTPFLVILAATSAFRPINALLAQFLLTLDRSHLLMRLEVVRVVALFSALFTLGQLGAVAAAFAVGIAGMLHTILLVHHCAGLQVRPLALLRACVPAMLAAALMVAVVLMLGAILSASGVAPLVSLVAQVLGGGLTYITAFVLLAPDLVADLRDRLRPGSQHR